MTESIPFLTGIPLHVIILSIVKGIKNWQEDSRDDTFGFKNVRGVHWETDIGWFLIMIKLGIFYRGLNVI